MKFKNTEQVNADITRALHDSVTSRMTAKDIAFHMTDWKDDLERLIKVYDASHLLSDKEISSIIHQFLAHVPNHLAAAMKLIGYGSIEDIFEVGVLDNDKSQ